MWMVRNPAGQHADDLLQKNVIGIGCGEVARHITEAMVPEDYYDAVRTAASEPVSHKMRCRHALGQVAEAAERRPIL
jgi:hypothetical protein